MTQNYNVSQGNDLNFGNYKDSAVKLCKRIRVSFVQDSLNKKIKTTNGWYLSRRKIQLFSDKGKVAFLLGEGRGWAEASEGRVTDFLARKKLLHVASIWYIQVKLPAKINL